MKTARIMAFELMFLASIALIGMMYFTLPAQDARYQHSLGFLGNLKDYLIK